MLSGVPNFAFAFGYTNSSWTLKVGLLCEHFCRLLSHMDAQGYDIARPEIGDPVCETRPMLDFAAGYVQRALDRIPKQGSGDPWRVSMNYYYDVEQLREGLVVDPHLHLASSGKAVAEPQRTWRYRVTALGRRDAASRIPAVSAPVAPDRAAAAVAPSSCTR